MSISRNIKLPINLWRYLEVYGEKMFPLCDDTVVLLRNRTARPRSPSTEADKFFSCRRLHHRRPETPNKAKELAQGIGDAFFFYKTTLSNIASTTFRKHRLKHGSNLLRWLRNNSNPAPMRLQFSLRRGSVNQFRNHKSYTTYQTIVNSLRME